MTPSPEPPSSDDEGTTRNEARKPEIGPAHKRDKLLQRVRAARKRLTPGRGAVARLR